MVVEFCRAINRKAGLRPAHYRMTQTMSRGRPHRRSVAPAVCIGPSKPHNRGTTRRKMFQPRYSVYIISRTPRTIMKVGHIFLKASCQVV
jgi:hypothetical protein